ncbi:MAG: biotin/lipoate A/B protein ligase family protein [Chloroflexi bacterium]|nr:biotin/lipoate A/B protein ligase family protein [Chloroflexota bacterium]
MTQNWRLITSPARSGAFNMALDEAMLIFASQKKVPPTLRLYQWDPPTVSLGYGQPVKDVSLEAISQKGWQLVRRPTGGRAILHTDEITYSITAPVDDPVVSGTLLDSYHRIAQALVLALSRLGLTANADHIYPQQQEKSFLNPICFEVPSNYEITVFGKKLIGSAQARKSGGVLQHGSLPLWGDLTRITEILKYPSEHDQINAAKILLDHATTLQSATGKTFDWEQASLAFIGAFSECLNLEFENSQPSAEESILVEKLIKTKYGSEEWNLRI